MCVTSAAKAGSGFQRENSWGSREQSETEKLVYEPPGAILPRLRSLTLSSLSLPSATDDVNVTFSALVTPGNIISSLRDTPSSAWHSIEPQAAFLSPLPSSSSANDELVVQSADSKLRDSYWSTVMMKTDASPRPSIVSGTLRQKLSLRPALAIIKKPTKVVKRAAHLSNHLSAHPVTANAATSAHTLPIPGVLQSKLPTLVTQDECAETEQITVKAYSCRDCKLRFETRTGLSEHAAECENKNVYRPFICNHCGASFHKNSNLVKHISLVELKLRPYKCTLCDAKFGQKSNLSSHIRVTHEGERKYECKEPTCGRRFGQNSGLRAHVRTVHLGVRDFVCDCGRRFGSRGDLNRHIRSTHQKLLPFPCVTCGKAFSRKSVLQRHRTAVHGEVLTPAQR